jgi:RIO kinase 1
LSQRKSGRPKWDDEEYPWRPARRSPPGGADPGPAEFPEGQQWSSWDQTVAGARGPRPWPPWLVTESAAVDTDLGLLKTGKEADVHLVERAIPGTDRRCLLASKRYRSAEHRLFHRDATYLEGRRVRRSRETRAMATRTAFGRQLIAQQWAAAEFSALSTFHSAGLPVPYPVQVLGSELMLEFVGTADGEAAPRLVALRPDPDLLGSLWEQLLDALILMVGLGFAHGDLSAYNLLVHRERLLVIDLPQVVDVVAHPQGLAFLRRDVDNVAGWFRSRGLAVDADLVYTDLAARLGW